VFRLGAAYGWRSGFILVPCCGKGKNSSVAAEDNQTKTLVKINLVLNMENYDVSKQ